MGGARVALCHMWIARVHLQTAYSVALLVYDGVIVSASDEWSGVDTIVKVKYYKPDDYARVFWVLQCKIEKSHTTSIWEYK